MAEDFIRRGDKALEAKIASARNADEIRDILLADQLQRGLPTKYDRVALPTSSGDSSAQSSAPVELSSRTPQYFEVLYPHGNDRIEISAATQEEFDRRKAAVLAAYGKR